MDEDSQTPEQLPPGAAKRLKALRACKKLIPYRENLPEKKSPRLLCSIRGAPENNEPFVELKSPKGSFVEATESGLIYPPMEELIFGMDVLDSQVGFGLAEQMFLKYRAALLKGKAS